MTDVTLLNRRKGGIKAQLTKLANFISDEIEQSDVVDLQNKIELLYKLENKLEDLKLDYYKILKDTEVQAYEDELEHINDDLQKHKVSLKRLLNSKENRNSDIKCINSLNNHPKISIKLPDIPLPKFDGSYEIWNNFKSQFNSLIDSNDLLSSEQKLYYLQSSLVGSAKQIQSVDDTYESLYDALTNRFDNKRLIVNSHMKSLLMLENINFESAEKLRSLVDSILKHVRALKVMNLELNNFSENLLINLILRKLDNTTSKEYEMSLNTSELPKWDTFISFLQDRCQILENIQGKSSQIKAKFSQNKIKNFVLNSSNPFCNLCKKKTHELYNCDSFLKMNPLQRFDHIKKQRLCINCFSGSHHLSACNSKYVCKYCQLKHNYLLCRNKNLIPESKDSSQFENIVTLKQKQENEKDDSNKLKGDDVIHEHLFSCFTSERKNVVLSTATVYVKNKNGNLIRARAMLDLGSEVNCLSYSFANAMGLKQQKINMSICSLAGKTIHVKNEVCTAISNSDNSFSAKMNFIIVPKITDWMPAKKIDISKFTIPENISLADPRFYIPGKIDMLIGAEMFFNIVQNDVIKITDSLILKETVFGYIISGSINGNQNKHFSGFITQLNELNENVKKFWESENLDDTQSWKNEEIECEKHFCETYKRDPLTGKYIVSLPIKEEIELGDSYALAKARLENLSKTLNKNLERKKLYSDFLDEYLKLGHMQGTDFSDNTNYFMPHHGVYKPDSTTTKLRVVFNASAPTSNGVSLNDCLLKGGVVQEDLFSILLRFRKYKIAFVADIQKMYRQIWVNPNQCNLQCILWKNQPLEEIKLFKLLTVTYGTACAPFLATRVLKQLALDEENRYPLASAATLSDFYVDDILTGADNLHTALDLQRQLIAMLRSAGMELHKWCSNDNHLLDHVPSNKKEYDFDEGKNNSVKTLGLRWDPKEETFFFNVTSCLDVPTKRNVLSEIARLYDPLGLLGSVITLAKVYLQNLWKLNLEWNEEIPEPERSKWITFRRKLLEIKNVSIPRFVLIENMKIIELHGFSDAAKEAYGAVVYLRCFNSSGNVKVSLLCSKSRVSPIKELTIPRLELCGAVLLARLVKKILESLKMSIDRVFLWTDSEIVLAWIVKPLHQLKLFVKNRVSVIQDLTERQWWRHVSTKENPADLISRGIEPNKIKNCDLWWHGPSFLQQNLEIPSYHAVSIENNDHYVKELKELTEPLSAFVQEQDTFDLIDRYSSFTKLQRVTAWCLRFIGNARNLQQKVNGCLSSAELSYALTCLVKIVQSNAFPDELQCLIKEKVLPTSSNLLNLCPFIDSEGVIRVGGRLKNSNLNLDNKNPMLLPNNHNFTNLVINHYHILYFHTGPEGTMSLIRNKFWIIRGRNIVRKVIKKCIVCLKVSSKGAQQVMADLPSVRVMPSRVYTKVGIDYAGPFSIKTFSGRVKKLNKCYVCIFICLVVKAVHFEIVHNLTTEAFLGALKRFIARRGKPFELFSDNASNFVGANNELRKIVKDLFKTSSKDKIEDYISREGIKWNFNPPLAPHFGGLWEAGIKSLKHHLKRIVGNTILTHEEFLTLVTQIEAILNSRPLCPLSDDPNDFSALTPAHFLIGSSLVALPERDYSDLAMNRLDRWQLVQKFVNTLWKRWSNEYLNKLQQRPKWSKGQVMFNKGDIVLVKNTEHSGYLRWHLARIVNVYPGKDNIVRVVSIKDKNGIHKRAVSSIAALPFVN